MREGEMLCPGPWLYTCSLIQWLLVFCGLVEAAAANSRAAPAALLPLHINMACSCKSYYYSLIYFTSSLPVSRMQAINGSSFRSSFASMTNYR